MNGSDVDSGLDERKSGGDHNDTKMGFARVAVLMMIAEIVIKAIGFIKQSVIAYYFGGNSSMDVYFLSSDFINGISNAIMASVRIAVIAVYTRKRYKGDKLFADSLMSQITEVVLCVTVFITIAYIILIGPIGTMLAPSYTAELRIELNAMLVSFSGILPLTSICMIYDSVLNSHERYFVTKTRSLIYSVVIIASCVFLSKTIGNQALVVAQYVTLILYFAVQKIASKRIYRFKASKIKEKGALSEVLHSAIPLLISNSMVYVNYQIDNSISTSLGSGSVSALAYAHTLDEFFIGVAITSLAAILFPHMANLIARGEEERGIETLQKSTITMVILLVPVAVITFLLSKEVVQIVYMRGKFDVTVSVMAATVLAWYALRYPFVCVRDFCVQGLYAFGETRLPMRNSVISMVLNIILSICLSRFFGISGIPLATTLSVVLCSFLNINSLTHITSTDILNGNGSSLIKCTISISVTVFILFALQHLLLLEGIVKCIVYFTITSFAYISILLCMKEQITVDTCNRILKKFKAPN